METKEKMRIASGAVILLTLGVLVLLSSFGIYSLDKSWPILIIVFALFTLVQSPKDAGGWIIGAAGLLFLFFENWFDQVGAMTMNLVRSAILIVVAFFLFKTMRKKES
ncbi:MAG: LiaF transmembrane domain-containing protein [Syntrophaceae bacterium]